MSTESETFKKDSLYLKNCPATADYLNKKFHFNEIIKWIHVSSEIEFQSMFRLKEFYYDNDEESIGCKVLSEMYLDEFSGIPSSILFDPKEDQFEKPTEYEIEQYNKAEKKFSDKKNAQYSFPELLKNGLDYSEFSAEDLCLIIKKISSVLAAKLKKEENHD